MIRAERVIPASAAEVPAVLADGREYRRWVVGAEAVRGVAPTWPAPGSRPLPGPLVRWRGAAGLRCLDAVVLARRAGGRGRGGA